MRYYYRSQLTALNYVCRKHTSWTNVFMKGSTNTLLTDAINTESMCFPAISDHDGSTHNMLRCIELHCTDL